MTSWRSPKAFTLIELLVVVAILSILAALLAPALKKARDQARQIGCMSNLKQIGTCLQLYANDNEGWIMIGFQMYPDWTALPCPLYGLVEHPLDTSGAPTSQRGYVPRTPPNWIFHCPAATDESNKDWGYMSYVGRRQNDGAVPMLEGIMLTGGVYGMGYVQISKFPGKAFFTDASLFGWGKDYHNGSVNVLYGDGGVGHVVISGLPIPAAPTFSDIDAYFSDFDSKR